MISEGEELRAEFFSLQCGKDRKAKLYSLTPDIRQIRKPIENQEQFNRLVIEENNYPW